ncbi:hypothetical protein [Legionella drancourtii]|uniref:Uncharacterized protein n=1 Tax=Legionella drancourtii LLAP12 TaxID=658187 RepID=G9EKR7_9GAMM|nr:hypothetical protein [Legionella drancourtii]EHL32119.1 hypothetical protein LDG_5806 [Legionella drancourtii LLAP12]
MQTISPNSLEIEHLLVELALCINDLQVYRQKLTMDDANQAELSLSKLEALISFVRNHKSPIRLAAV